MSCHVICGKQRKRIVAHRWRCKHLSVEQQMLYVRHKLLHRFYDFEIKPKNDCMIENLIQNVLKYQMLHNLFERFMKYSNMFEYKYRNS